MNDTTRNRTRTHRAACIDEAEARSARAERTSPLSRAQESAEENFLTRVESELGWKLDAGQRALALLRRESGEDAATVAGWLHRLESARTELNDPAVRDREQPPSRPEENDPRRFTPTDARRYKP